MRHSTAKKMKGKKKQTGAEVIVEHGGIGGWSHLLQESSHILTDRQRLRELAVEALKK